MPSGEGELPAPRLVDWDALHTATSEEPFVHEAFELLKDGVILLTFVAGIRLPHQNNGLRRNQAIVVGHFARMIKLMKTLIRQVVDGHGGDQQLDITREFMESASTVAYLLEEGGDESRYDAYVFDSLIAEREFLKNVRAQVALRGGVMIPIEQRIERSITETMNAGGVLRVDDIPSRRTNGWPSAEARLSLLGPTAYSAYRVGSNSIHGAFADIYKHHLEEVSGGFEIELRPQPFRPQPLLAMALLALTNVPDYATRIFGQ